MLPHPIGMPHDDASTASAQPRHWSTLQTAEQGGGRRRAAGAGGRPRSSAPLAWTRTGHVKCMRVQWGVSLVSFSARPGSGTELAVATSPGPRRARSLSARWHLWKASVGGRRGSGGALQAGRHRGAMALGGRLGPAAGSGAPGCPGAAPRPKAPLAVPMPVGRRAWGAPWPLQHPPGSPASRHGGLGDGRGPRRAPAPGPPPAGRRRAAAAHALAFPACLVECRARGSRW